MLKIIDVTTSKQFRQFAELPWRVYRDPASLWVPPLPMHLRMLVGNLGEPGKRILLALEDGEPVARLGVKIHRTADSTALHFGFVECLEGQGDALVRLVEEAHQLSPELPMLGPVHFALEDTYSGLLVEGFEHEPYFLMPYNPPYYCDYLEQAGMHKVKDLLAHRFLPENVRLDLAEQTARKAQKCGIEVRLLNRSRLTQEVRSMVDVFDSALAGNWGFEPIDEERIQDLILLTRFFLDPKAVWLASHEGRDVGSLFVLPNYNPLIKAARGRLTPGFFLRFLRWRRYVDSFRGYGLGVRQELSEQMLGALVAGALANALLSRGQQQRWRALEVSWVLEDNVRMNTLARALGGSRYKVYRLFQRPPAR